MKITGPLTVKNFTVDTTLQCQVREDYDGIWVARCLDLNLMSQGGTESEAREALRSAIEMVLRATGRLTLDRFQPLWKPPYKFYRDEEIMKWMKAKN